jgi:maltose alpha-D-glucosyltransferase/alpha-amylase
VRHGRQLRDPEWYKDAVIYELHVRSFQDSNADGIGDFPGLTRRLAYLRDLGVSALWLLPFYPSPLRDDGYDIADYMGVHRDYGTLEEFDTFLARAHALGLRVFTELVINHTSDQHAWFERARTAPPGSVERDFYVWSDTPERYAGTRVIFQDFERSNWSWDPVARAYFWHRFYSHQPDLNYRNPAVLDAVLEVIDFWFGRGVDGMRLDAVPYLLEEEGTTSENLAETHAVLKAIRRHVDTKFPGHAFIAEANQWPEDAVAYFGGGDESHMVFHFPLMPRLFMAARQEDRLPIEDILAQTPAPPPSGQWALFLRNHDELTLEMVTEEERLYMYHVFAADPAARINLGIRRRLAPLLGNDRRRIELMNALLFSLPGTPVIYYGDEIGMGDNIYLGDRDGVRTPMQWSGDRNAGFSDADQQRLFLPLIVSEQFHHQTNHVAAQEHSPHSLLRWMQQIIALRKRHQAFGRGGMTAVPCPNSRILAFVREWEDQVILVVANLSRFPQHAALDLGAFAGRYPVEMFGRTPFPVVGAEPYALTLDRHGFYWLDLQRPRAGGGPRPSPPPVLAVETACEEILQHPSRGDLEAVLAHLVESGFGFFSRGRPVLAVSIRDTIEVGAGADRLWFAFVRAEYGTGEPQAFLLALQCLDDMPAPAPDRVVLARVTAADGREYHLVEALHDASAVHALLQAASSGDAAGARGRFQVTHGEGLPQEWPAATELVRRDRPHANAVLRFGDEYVAKLYRVIDAGIATEVEIGSVLREQRVEHVAPLVGALEYVWNEGHGRQSAVVGVVHRFVPNEGEAAARSIEAAAAFMDRARKAGRTPPAPALGLPLRVLAERDPSQDDAADLLGSYTGFLDLLADRVAGLHRALAHRRDPAFAPEPFTPLTRRSLYQHVRTRLVSTFERLRIAQPTLEDRHRREAVALLERREALLSVIGQVLSGPLEGRRIRCHGNLHLGQVLLTGDDLCIIDFDGEAGLPGFERRIKHTPLHDVVSLLRSLAFAAGDALDSREEDDGLALAWSQQWQDAVSRRFLASYRRSMEGSGLLPQSPEAGVRLFTLSLAERIAHEIGLELERGSQGRQLTWALRDLLGLAESA